MTKQELIDHVCKANTNMTKKTTADVVDAIFNAVRETVKTSERFSYPGFGTFELRNRKARMGRDPRTGAAIQIKASRTVGFRPAKGFKEML